jgi:hypothetical protein
MNTNYQSQNDPWACLSEYQKRAVSQILIKAKEGRTEAFTDTELRLMIACFRRCDVRALLAEFEAALDERIKRKLGKGEV